jgi:hypothetical protein
MRREILAAAFVAATLGASTARGAAVGSPAPALEPTKWLNAKGNVTWGSFKGRLVMVEKWATW